MRSRFGRLLERFKKCKELKLVTLRNSSKTEVKKGDGQRVCFVTVLTKQ
jgi:hypothetical protein